MIDKLRTSGAWIFVPYFKLMVYRDGVLSELPEGTRDRILSYEIETAESGATLLTFDIDDTDFFFLNSDIVAKETPVYFECGWANDWNNITRFNGYIADIEIEFNDSGYPVLSFTCMDETHIMNREEKTRTFERMKRSTIARTIFAEYGIQCKVSDSWEAGDDIPEKITQSNETDIAFLQKLAGEVEGAKYICYVENGVGYFGSRDLSQDPQVDLHYRDSEGNDVSSFKCSISKESTKVYQATGDVSTIDGCAVLQVYECPDEGEPDDKNGIRIVGNDRPEKKESNKTTANSDKKVGADELPKYKMNELLYNACVGNLTPIVAIPLLTARKCINVLGVGNCLSGKYYVSKTRLSGDKNGFTQDIELRKTEFGGYIQKLDTSRDGRPSPLIR